MHWVAYTLAAIAVLLLAFSALTGWSPSRSSGRSTSTITAKPRKPAPKPKVIRRGGTIYRLVTVTTKSGRKVQYYRAHSPKRQAKKDLMAMLGILTGRQWRIWRNDAQRDRRARALAAATA